MLRVIGLAFATLFLATPVFAQSQCAPIQYGAVLTVAQWQTCWASKNDNIGYPPLNRNGDIMGGNLQLASPNPLTIPPTLVGPVSPQNGSVWLTTSGLFYKTTAGTFGPLGTFSGVSSSIGGSPIATAGTCVTSTVTITGATSTMGVNATPQTDPGSAIYWKAEITSANTVTVYVCTVTAATTPTASLYNVRVFP